MSIAASPRVVVAQQRRTATHGLSLYIAATLVVVATFLRMTVLQPILGDWFTNTVDVAYMVGLAGVGVTTAVAKGTLFRWSCVPFAVALVLSALDSINPRDALARCIFLLAMIYAVGPGFAGPRQRNLQLVFWNAFRRCTFLCLLVSVLWVVLGLPNLGRGDFTAAMNHSMVLGPTMAFAGVFAYSKFLSGRRRWGIVACLAAGLCVMSVSRIAMAAFASGILAMTFVHIKKWRAMQALGGVTLIAAIFNFDAIVLTLVQFLPDDVAAGIHIKMSRNSRDVLWDARIEEFASDPIFGIGVMQAFANSHGTSSDGHFEPGSSYFVILSSTGLVGATTLGMLLLSGARNLARWPDQMAQNRRIEAVGLLGVFMMHGAAEGYWIAAGSSMAALFWLTLGGLFAIDTPHSKTAQELWRHR